MHEIIAIIGLCVGSMVIGGAMVAEWYRYRAVKFFIADGVLHCLGPLSQEDIIRIREAWAFGGAREKWPGVGL